ncbi:MAG: hypothetical protein GEU79_17305 [Acidimicrobiia bacterium]|nr:hypothetical protein [Acidimicrobiia bacterium]
MIADGSLNAERQGKEWAVEPRSLERNRRHPRPAGRPWKPSSVWALIALVEGYDDQLGPLDRHRARQRLDRSGLEELAPRLSSRAELRRFYCHPSGLEPLANEEAFVRSGVSAAAEHNAGIIARDVIEGYVSYADASPLIDHYGLEESTDQPNVLMRIVQDDVWPFPPSAQVAPRSVVALDLLETDEPRARRAGARLLEALHSPNATITAVDG